MSNSKNPLKNAIYIPNRNIKSVSFILDGILKKANNDEIIDGIYYREGKPHALKTSSVNAEELTKTIKKEAKALNYTTQKYVLPSDVKSLIEVGFSEKQIKIIYLGLSIITPIKCDNEFQGDDGILARTFNRQENYSEAIEKIIELAKHTPRGYFEAGLKYPEFNWKPIFKKFKVNETPKIFKIDNEKNSKYYENSAVVCFIGKDLVIAQTIHKERKINLDDYANGKIEGGYWTIASSNPDNIFEVIEMLTSQEDGYLKDLGMYYNGLSYSVLPTLEKENIKYKKGGEISSSSVGENTNFGIVEDETKTQFLINGRWIHKSIVVKEEINQDALVNQIISRLKKERGEGNIRLYHGTDDGSYQKIIETGFLGDGRGITFFTSNKSEAKEYALNKSKYRGQNSNGKVIEIEMPRYAVKKNRATGEYESEFQLEKNGSNIYKPTTSSLLKEHKFEKGGSIEDEAEKIFRSIIKKAKELRISRTKLEAVTINDIKELLKCKLNKEQIEIIYLGATNILDVKCKNGFEKEPKYLSLGILSSDWKNLKAYSDEIMFEVVDLAKEKPKYFHLALKKPVFNWDEIFEKYSITTNPTFIQSYTTNDRKHGTLAYSGKNIVIAREFSVKESSEIDFKEFDNANIHDGYWTIASSDPNVITDVTKSLFSQTNGSFEYINVFCNKLTPDILPQIRKLGIKFEKGGSIESKSKSVLTFKTENFEIECSTETMRTEVERINEKVFYPLKQLTEAEIEWQLDLTHLCVYPNDSEELHKMLAILGVQFSKKKIEAIFGKEYAFGGLLPDEDFVPENPSMFATGGHIEDKMDYLNQRIANIRELQQHANDEDYTRYGNIISQLEIERDNLNKEPEPKKKRGLFGFFKHGGSVPSDIIEIGVNKRLPAEKEAQIAERLKFISKESKHYKMIALLLLSKTLEEIEEILDYDTENDASDYHDMLHTLLHISNQKIEDVQSKTLHEIYKDAMKEAETNYVLLKEDGGIISAIAEMPVDISDDIEGDFQEGLFTGWDGIPIEADNRAFAIICKEVPRAHRADEADYALQEGLITALQRKRIDYFNEYTVPTQKFARGGSINMTIEESLRNRINAMGIPASENRVPAEYQNDYASWLKEHDPEQYHELLKYERHAHLTKENV